MRAFEIRLTKLTKRGNEETADIFLNEGPTFNVGIGLVRL